MNFLSKKLSKEQLEFNASKMTRGTSCLLVHAYNPRLRQENHEFEAGLNYTMRHCLKKSKAKKKKKKSRKSSVPAMPTDAS